MADATVFSHRWTVSTSRAMAVAELIALREQLPTQKKAAAAYDPKDRSLANTIRVLRRARRKPDIIRAPGDGLLEQLEQGNAVKHFPR